MNCSGSAKCKINLIVKTVFQNSPHKQLSQKGKNRVKVRKNSFLPPLICIILWVNRLKKAFRRAGGLIAVKKKAVIISCYNKKILSADLNSFYIPHLTIQLQT